MPAAGQAESEDGLIVPIYILAGQSNALRIGLDAALVGALGGRGGPFEVVKLAVGATSLIQAGTDWNVHSTGELYDQLLAAVRDRIAYVVSQGYTPQIASVFWIQGEADATHEKGALQYQQNLTDFINRIRADLGTEMPFIIAELNSLSAEPYVPEVRAAQLAVAAKLDNVRLVETDDLPLTRDSIHYTAASRVVLAHRLAEALSSPPDQAGTSGYVSLTGPYTFTGTAGNDTMDYGGDDAHNISNDFRDLTLLGGDGKDRIITGAGNSVVDGGAGDDRIFAHFGSDRIYGGGGSDIIDGSLNYMYLQGATDPHIPWSFNRDFIDGGDGNDVLIDMVGSDTVLGGAGNDSITVGWGDDVLDGGSGADSLVGGSGNDSYLVDQTDDIVTELAAGGSDTVFTPLSCTLGDNLENLTFTGAAANDGTGNSLANLITGNSAANRLSGLAGNDVLDGGAGADTLIGGLDGDTYVVDSAGDVIIELAGGGTDTVRSAVPYVLGDTIERLTLTGTANLDGAGNSLVNIITGNAGNNRLDGGAGADSLAGGSGDDTYLIDNIGDTVREFSGQGNDLVLSSVSFGLGNQYIEYLILTGTADLSATGNAVANNLTGNAGKNVLNGGAGADRMSGGAGDDTYYVDNVLDIVLEGRGQGNDSLYSSASVVLGDQYIELVTLTGAGNIAATGNAIANALIGNSGNNILDGGTGADSLTGGLGADRFVFGASTGVDTIRDFSAAQGDMIDIHVYSNGVVDSRGIILTQVGADTLIHLSSASSITVMGAVKADVLSHIVW